MEQTAHPQREYELRFTATVDRCPWCNSEISHAEFLRIKEEIRAEEEAKLEEQRKSLETDFKLSTDAIRREGEEKLAQAQEKLAQALAEQEERLARTQLEGRSREEALREELQKAAEAMKEQEAEIREKAKAEEREEHAELLRKKTDELLKAQEIAKVAHEQLQQVYEKQEAVIEDATQKVLEEATTAKQAELQELRRVLEKDRDDQLLKQRAEHNSKNERLEQQIKSLERQIQERIATELVEGGEIDLFQQLRDEFPDDEITPINQGTQVDGFRFEVQDCGGVVGKIVIKARNCQQWRDSYVDKLRAVQRQEKADHAILSSTAFPQKHRQPFLVGRTVVVDPRQVVFIVRLLRESILQVYRLRLSCDEREAKVEALYKFIISPGFEQLFERADEVTKKLDDIDAEEKTAHDRVWKKRGSLIQSLRRSLRDVDREIQRIVEGA